MIRMPSSIEIFQILEGDWVVSRQIEPHGSFEGQASFTKTDSNTLHYEESGALILDGGGELSDATKRYLYKLEDEGIAVYFDDGPDKGKLFHRLEFDEAGIATATHDCPPDFYKTKMHLKSSDAFEVIHIVKGPRKDYKISSFYKRF